MIDGFVVVGVVMVLTEIIKWVLNKSVDPDLVTRIIPLVVLILAGGLNVVNAAVFGGMILTDALSQGILLGAIAGGVYSMGKAALGES